MKSMGLTFDDFEAMTDDEKRKLYESLSYPRTMYETEVLETDEDDNPVRMEVKPVHVLEYSVNKEVGATMPTFLVKDHGGKVGRRLVRSGLDYFISEDHARQEIAGIMDYIQANPSGRVLRQKLAEANRVLQWLKDELHVYPETAQERVLAGRLLPVIDRAINLCALGDTAREATRSEASPKL